MASTEIRLPSPLLGGITLALWPSLVQLFLTFASPKHDDDLCLEECGRRDSNTAALRGLFTQSRSARLFGGIHAMRVDSDGFVRAGGDGEGWVVLKEVKQYLILHAALHVYAAGRGASGAIAFASVNGAIALPQRTFFAAVTGSHAPCPSHVPTWSLS